jgi:hypothetical protein
MVRDLHREAPLGYYLFIPLTWSLVMEWHAFSWSTFTLFEVFCSNLTESHAILRGCI